MRQFVNPPHLQVSSPSIYSSFYDDFRTLTVSVTIYIVHDTNLLLKYSSSKQKIAAKVRVEWHSLQRRIVNSCVVASDEVCEWKWPFHFQPNLIWHVRVDIWTCFFGTFFYYTDCFVSFRFVFWLIDCKKNYNKTLCLFVSASLHEKTGEISRIWNDHNESRKNNRSRILNIVVDGVPINIVLNHKSSLMHLFYLIWHIIKSFLRD